MCTNVTATDTIGNIYDAGGPTANYSNNQICQFLINPGCNSGITISFSNFALESGFDFLYVYDGNSASGKLLLTATGSSIPSSVTAKSGTMFLVFTSDISVTMAGFSAAWTTLNIHIKPLPNFVFSSANPPLNTAVSFKDLSLNMPNKWHWNFGDGDTANLQNPYHSYKQYDTFSVKLIVNNCFGKDSIQKQIYPQDSAFINVFPNLFSDTSSSCNETSLKMLRIKNTGRGDLVYSFSADDSIPGIRLLALTYGVDYANEYSNTIKAVSQYFPSFSLIEKNSSNADSLKKALTNKNILLIAEQASGSAAVFKTFSKPLQDYVYNGGNVVFCGSASSQTNCMFNTGLFHGNYIRNASGQTLKVLQKQHPLTYNIDTILFGTDATYACKLTDPNIVHLISDTLNNDILAYREFGNGKVFFIAFDYSSYDSNSAKMISNVFKWINTGLIPPWIIINAGSDTMSKNDSSFIPVRFETHGLKAGNYFSLLKISSNDIKNPHQFIRCNLKINGSPSISISNSLLQYNSCMQFSNVVDTIIVYNTGCDSLKVTALNFSSTQFWAQPSSFTILPGNNYPLIVHFNPQIVGSFTDSLLIISNAGNSKVKLKGTATLPSAANVDPKSFTLNMSCEDSIQLILRIKNSNQTPLVLGIEGKNAKDSIHLLALTYGVDYYLEYTNTITAINSYLTAYHLSELNTTSSIRLDSALQFNDVLLIAEQQSGSPTIFGSFSTVLQAFVNRGGTVIFCGSNGSQMNCMFNTGLFSGSAGAVAWNSSSFLNVFDSTNEITTGIGSAIPSLNATFTANITNTDAKTLIDYSGTYDVVTTRNVGKGRAVFIAFDYFDFDSNSSKIIANAVKSSVKQIKPAWVSLSSYTDSLAFNDSSLIGVTINTTGVFSGNYHYNIRIHTNDPIRNNILIPIDLQVHCRPYANFYVFSNFINRNDSISFIDKSRNFPTAWQWSLSGATPNSPTVMNPVAHYPNYGLYNVKLIVSNVWGSDTIEKTAFVHVENLATMCSVTKTEFDSGRVFDQGGPLNNYYAMQTCQLLIAPPCALKVILRFDEFNVENYWDYLYVYDGIDAKAPLLQSLTGNSIPAPIVANSGKMFLKFVTDQLVEESGFSAKWTSIIPIGFPPSAKFYADNYSPPVKSMVTFADSSLPLAKTWFWNFADGSTSDVQNPTHTFYKPGNYNVSLVVGNCYGTDSFNSMIAVQDYPVLRYKPSSLSGSSICSDIDTTVLSIYNSGMGELTYEADTGQKRLLELLTYTYGINLNQAYPNTLKALYQHYPNISLAEISTLDTNRFRKALANKDLLIVPEEQKAIPGIFTDFSYPLYEFVRNGGTAIFCGSYDAQSECLFNTGLFSGIYKDYVYLPTDSLTIVDTTNKITRGFGKKLPGAVITYYYSITNPDAVKLITYNGNDVLTYRKIGKGTIIFAGFNFYEYSDTLSQIFSNLVSWATSKPLVPWIKMIPSSAKITDSIHVKVLFDRTKTIAGNSSTLLAFYTNDTIAHKNYIPVQFNCSKKFLPVNLPSGADICLGDSLRIDAGNRFKTYNWNDSLWMDSSIMAKLSGMYSVTVTDSNNCVSSDSFRLISHPLPILNIQPIDSSICNNSNLVQLNAIPSGGEFSGKSVSSSVFYPNLATVGNATIYYSFTDSNSCTNIDSISTNILQAPIINLGKDSTLRQGDSLLLDAGSGHLSVVWNQTLINRYVFIPASIPGVYLFYVDVTDSNGCVASDSIYITIQDSTVSTNELKSKYSIKLYPNPTNKFLFVDLKFSEPSKTIISLYNADGKEMINSHQFTASAHVERLDLGMLAKGIYILKIIHGKNVDRFRVVVN